MKAINFTKEKIGWMFYDFANQSFVTIMVTVLFSMYFKDIIVAQEEIGTALWARSVSISMILVALTAPFIGALADQTQSRKLSLIIVTYISILFTILLFFMKQGDILKTMIIFIVAKYCYTIGTVIYNSFLPDIAEKHELNRFSGLSWGIGYLGGLFALFAVMPIARLNLENYLNYRFSFILVAIIFFVFSIPTFIWLKEKKRNIKQQINGFKSMIHMTIQQLYDTAKSIRKYSELIKFLISFFLFSNGIFVVISFASIYGSTRFGMTEMNMITYFIIAQPSAFLGAWLFGYVVDWIGAKKAISITLIIWMIAIIGAYLVMNKSQFYFIGILAGFAMGSTQACSRTLLATLTPENKSAEFFGFYSVFASLATIAGLLIYGEISRITGNQKNAILSIIIFFILSFIVMQFVKLGRNHET